MRDFDVYLLVPLLLIANLLLWDLNAFDTNIRDDALVVEMRYLTTSYVILRMRLDFAKMSDIKRLEARGQFSTFALWLYPALVFSNSNREMVKLKYHYINIIVSPDDMELFEHRVASKFPVNRTGGAATYSQGDDGE